MRNAIEQMLNIALPDLAVANRRSQLADPFVDGAPDFCPLLAPRTVRLQTLSTRLHAQLGRSVGLVLKLVLPQGRDALISSGAMPTLSESSTTGATHRMSDARNMA